MPVVASLGVLDGIRIGPDVAPGWEMPDVTRYLHDVYAFSARYAVVSRAHRLWRSAVIEPDRDLAYFGTRHCLLDEPEQPDPPSLLAEVLTVEHRGGHRFVGDGHAELAPVAQQPPGDVDWLPT